MKNILIIAAISLSLSHTVYAQSPNPTKCKKHSTLDPVSFILVVIDGNGLPKDIVVPPGTPTEVDYTNVTQKFESFKNKDREVKQKTTICWRAVVEYSTNNSGYRAIDKKISIIWRPSQKHTKPKKFIVEEKISADSPEGIIYKYTIATDQ